MLHEFVVLLWASLLDIFMLQCGSGSGPRSGSVEQNPQTDGKQKSMEKELFNGCAVPSRPWSFLSVFHTAVLPPPTAALWNNEWTALPQRSLSRWLSIRENPSRTAHTSWMYLCVRSFMYQCVSKDVCFLKGYLSGWHNLMYTSIIRWFACRVSFYAVMAVSKYQKPLHSPTYLIMPAPNVRHVPPTLHPSWRLCGTFSHLRESFSSSLYSSCLPHICDLETFSWGLSPHLTWM